MKFSPLESQERYPIFVARPVAAFASLNNDLNFDVPSPAGFPNLLGSGKHSKLGGFSIELERDAQLSLLTRRAAELSHRRKLTASSEKFKFF
jgi:hypothetical protein